MNFPILPIQKIKYAHFWTDIFLALFLANTAQIFLFSFFFSFQNCQATENILAVNKYFIKSYPQFCF